MKKGLYNQSYEHDACGVGMICNINGAASHAIIKDSLAVLANLDHRGARGAEHNTGDGAGILMQVPDKFLRRVLSFKLPRVGNYAVGMVYFQQNRDQHEAIQAQFEEIATSVGQEVLGWREVPTEGGSLGRSAQKVQPIVKQVIIARGDRFSRDQMAFERKLYVMRRIAEAKMGDKLYFCSLSSRTVVYKGMLTPGQVPLFYPELLDPLMESAIALVHSRFSTNTFPSWDRAHPYRYLVHNGEINTLRGNVNWMKARESLLASDKFGDDLKRLLPVLDESGSDSAMFDNCLEFLHLCGRSLPHAMAMMIPQPWENDATMDPQLRAFYRYHSCLMDPWDGPAAIIFSDGAMVGAVLDRNGLRPCRYYVTRDDRVIMASEVGVLDIDPSLVRKKGRLRPGEMFLVDTTAGRIISDKEIKSKLAWEYPYSDWLKKNIISIDKLPELRGFTANESVDLLTRQLAFGYTREDLKLILEPMATDAEDPTGSMGMDAPLAVLSERPQLLYNYFHQLFAQVTNPPIDTIREKIITCVETMLGSEGNLLDSQPESCRQVVLRRPVINCEELERLRNIDRPGLHSTTISSLYDPTGGSECIEAALNRVFSEADKAIADGSSILIVSDRGVDAEHAPIPTLLVVAGLHHHLIRNGTRTRVGIVCESGEPREVHHFALLLGFGASAICPYVAYETICDLIEAGRIKGISYHQAARNFATAATKGVLKVISKMGISTIQGYRGAQIFEALGINKEVVDRYFTHTPTRIGGVGLGEIAEEVRLRHARAFVEPVDRSLDAGGSLQWRHDGEEHLFNPQTIYTLQKAVREGSYDEFKKYSALMADQESHNTLRGLLDIPKSAASIPIEEVESAASIVKRFKTGAMSLGSISPEAHESLAIAMNRLGGKSNSGEGGESPERYKLDSNGDSRCSAIKQIASGRFGVTSNYLVHATELQIKIAQGAKPGEGGQLPGTKVYPWIAKTRMSTPGVGLVSPPPHHDIYSIEDLAQLIYDLKNANRLARVTVKLVSEVGVGTIAAGVAKGHADVILISGYDGGTGAAPRTSIRHAGLPWELGLSETHQTLVLNNLRDRVRLETDGKLLTGRDVVIAALLGAEEFGFATGPLISIGCVMMRVCHKDTCPVGVATQDPELRKQFAGKPEHVVNFMSFIAEEVREHMAALGFRTFDEMVGHSELLSVSARKNDHWKAKGVDLSSMLEKTSPAFEFDCDPETSWINLENTLDVSKLLPLCKDAIETGQPVSGEFDIVTTQRSVGTVLGSVISRRHGEEGLPDKTIQLHFKGSAGLSFGAFVPKGVTLTLEGDANDYFGKGLCGGKITVYPQKSSQLNAAENVIIGNTAFYGATAGEAFISGEAGERFCVRNSGVTAVVEAVGDHACEYMTGGVVVVLGPTGKNFAAGMTGGLAYVYDPTGDFLPKCNLHGVLLGRVEDYDEIKRVHALIKKHLELTGSKVAADILNRWEVTQTSFVKILPADYKRVMDITRKGARKGLTSEEAILTSFAEERSTVA